MKRKITVTVLVLTLILSVFAGCSNGNSNEDASSTDAETTTAVSSPEYKEAYASVLENAYHIASASDDDYEPAEGEYGIWQATIGYTSEESLANIGYTLMDIGGDETPELIITFLEDGSHGEYILDLYTLKDDEPVNIADGGARNTFALTSDGEVFNSGSDGAASQIFGIYGFDSENNFGCKEIWFTAEDEADPETIVCYYNENGVYDKNDAGTSVIDSREEFDTVFDNFSSKLITFEATPISSYKEEEADTVEVKAAYENDYNGTATDFNSFSDNGTDATAVVFYTGDDVQEFKIFALENTAVDDDGNLTYDKVIRYSDSILSAAKPLKAELTFSGDMPEWGISYTSSTGETVTKLLTISGKDGSLLLTDN